MTIKVFGNVSKKWVCVWLRCWRWDCDGIDWKMDWDFNLIYLLCFLVPTGNGDGTCLATHFLLFKGSGWVFSEYGMVRYLMKASYLIRVGWALEGEESGGCRRRWRCRCGCGCGCWCGCWRWTMDDGRWKKLENKVTKHAVTYTRVYFPK